MELRRRIRATALLPVLLLGALSMVVTTAAADPVCTTANVLSGSNFEIDTDANLKVDGSDPCIDWLAGGPGTSLRAGVVSKPDAPSGSGDNAFGQGTAEDNANPTIVFGSVPPKKSDLKLFGAFTETTAAGKFLELFWSRVQNPSGTTNMDFELNQKFCDPTATPTNCADNGNQSSTPETPVRTAGDKLIAYDLSKGGDGTHDLHPDMDRVGVGLAHRDQRRPEPLGSRLGQHLDHPEQRGERPRLTGSVHVRRGSHQLQLPVLVDRPVWDVRLGLPEEPLLRLVLIRVEGLHLPSGSTSRTARLS